MMRDSRMSSGRVPTIVNTLSIHGLAHDGELNEHLLRLFDIEPPRVVRRVVLSPRDLSLSLDEILVVVQVAGVRRDAIVLSQIFATRHFLTGYKRLVQLLAVS